MTAEICLLLLAALGLLLPILFTRWGTKPSVCPNATRDDALEALKLMKDWGVWLTGVQTAAIAALGAFFREHSFPDSAKFAVLFFTASIVADTVLLAGLPSIVLRLKREQTNGTTSTSDDPALTNDIYEMSTFADSRYGRRAGAVYVVSHVYFVLGILAFAYTFAFA